MTKEQEQVLVETLKRRVEDLAVGIERMKLAEYIDLLNDPKRLLYVNFLAGLARGIGTAIGFTLLGAIVAYYIKGLLLSYLPSISDMIAKVVILVRSQSGY